LGGRSCCSAMSSTSSRRRRGWSWRWTARIRRGSAVLTRAGTARLRKRAHGRATAGAARPRQLAGGTTSRRAGASALARPRVSREITATAPIPTQNLTRVRNPTRSLSLCGTLASGRKPGAWGSPAQRSEHGRAVRPLTSTGEH
jgi:hypothetical protein